MALLTVKTVAMLYMDYQRYSNEIMRLELDDFEENFEENKKKIAMLTTKLNSVIDEVA